MADANTRLTLWGIEVFIAVAEEQAISAAARRLGVSASAISQQLSSLEAALSATLLDRAQRPLQLTPAGAMFRRHAQTILNAEAEARADLGLADLSGLTTLRLGVIEDFDAEVTPRLLASMAADLKTCRFLLETGPSHRLLDGLESRSLDIAVTAELGAETEGWREVHPLLIEPFLAITPKGQSHHDLPLIHYTARHLMGRQLATHLAGQNLRLTPRFELDSYHAILAMVAEGQGWTILTPLALHHAPRFAALVDAAPLPFEPLSRSLTLSARAGVLRDMPAQIATRLRGLIAAQVVAPAQQQFPWLGDSLRVL